MKNDNIKPGDLFIVPDSIDYGAGWFDGVSFARRSTPRAPSVSEISTLSEAVACIMEEASIEELEESVLESYKTYVGQAYIAVFDRYRDEAGMFHKIAVIVFNESPSSFKVVEWTPTGVIELSCNFKN